MIMPHSINVYQISGDGIYGSKEKAVYGVNWSAIGTVSIEEAEEYIKGIQEAIRKAKAMNK